jgi:hypothetical protein
MGALLCNLAIQINGRAAAIDNGKAIERAYSDLIAEHRNTPSSSLTPLEVNNILLCDKHPEARGNHGRKLGTHPKKTSLMKLSRAKTYP